ncbi:MAG TPA: purine-nucleoside phosphorylase [Thermoanaerobaculia bacterium]|nr:purine-nucleoside phosphorylase [Thermoanaerobaculia bacterium]
MTAPATDDHLAEALAAGVRRWDEMGWPRPAAMLVSGSGLAVDLDAARGPVPLQELLPFAAHPIAGHPHELELLQPLPARPVLYQRGRLHPYQGYTPDETVFPIRLGALLGAKVLLMTNAAGGLRPDLRPGDLVLIRDQINLSGLNPLRGQLPEGWGPRFPDMSAAYDPALRALAHRRAEALGLAVGEGVYAGVAGPCYETPAEVRMLRALGGDVTGMSTVLEVIAARQMGMRVLVLSLVSNPAAGVQETPLDHEEVLAAAAHAHDAIRHLLTALLRDPELL